MIKNLCWLFLALSFVFGITERFSNYDSTSVWIGIFYFAVLLGLFPNDG